MCTGLPVGHSHWTQRSFAEVLQLFKPQLSRMHKLCHIVFSGENAHIVHTGHKLHCVRPMKISTPPPKMGWFLRRR